MPETQQHRRPKVIISIRYELDGGGEAEVHNPDVPEALMAFAEQVRGNAGARVAVTSDFSMKDFGNGASGSVTISLDCNQDDQTIPYVARSLSAWTIQLAEEHYKAADAKFQQMLFQKHPEKAPMVQPGPPPFKP